MDPESRVRIVLAGDVMTGRGIDQVLRAPGSPELFEAHARDARDYVALAERVHGPVGRALDGRALWGDALAALERWKPRSLIVNLETAVTASGEPWPGKGIHYRMNPSNVECLTSAGVHVCTLANNHVMDWGDAGLRDTLRSLRLAGLHTAGAGAREADAWAPAVVSIDAPGACKGAQLRVLSIAVSSSGVPAEWEATRTRPGVAWLPGLGEEAALRAAAAIAGEGPAVKVVSIHWGANWVAQVPQSHRLFARRLIDLGAADIVHGHSAHHPLPVEVYRGRLILHGCGDLINDYEGIRAQEPWRNDVGCLYCAEVAAGPDPRNLGRLAALEVVVLQRRRFRLVDADATARAWAWQQLGRHGFDAGTAAPGA